ncbi:hypothetical protein PSN45_000015 [Yamadazyma tenuis]|uniref:Micro-fibrillar-associated protein 1 C-terminal domain-containing protein n=1 Tax=Candida tenuis (strain ATCC 10573 / BCRC 21748 / CBS 615 / JCM 9827 / NBRC 10315 / NRRL Y-1498 / VKM Y-70) TaxID=590646 RepID=G3B9X7_CANTC|nr:uncharacterized protein CANTEDRAFT_114815 [Yamadazyma tenuis ATCC 10573]EGV61351.1 hypothetical protein CANTEDRAFT_114815 [Yamadazyma tenuis ATCC 10573]WEJ92565.1 hypothetical protein PSN45_000015 [Yamadazyma tenuis]
MSESVYVEDKAVMSDDNSDYSTTGTSSSGSESDEPVQLLQKPVFIKKSKSSDASASEAVAVANNTKHKVVTNLENANENIKSSQLGVEFNGVSDVDGLDPEKDYNEWKQREYVRYIRDRSEMIELEEIKADLIRRNQMSEEELVNIFEERQRAKPPNTTGASSRIGVFYNDDSLVQKLSERNYNEKHIDHSRPTKFKSS